MLEADSKLDEYGEARAAVGERLTAGAVEAGISENLRLETVAVSLHRTLVG